MPKIVKKGVSPHKPENDMDVEDSSEGTTSMDKTLGMINRLGQLVNLLAVLVIALFLFEAYTFYKVKGLEKTLGGLQAGAQGAQQQAEKKVEISSDKLKSYFSKDFIHFGDTKRKVLFVEFSDPSCPYCHIAAGKNPELNAQAGDQFKTVADGGTYQPPVEEMRKLVEEGKASYAMIYRNGHGNGILAMQALYCANEKGKFWDAHDILMSSSGYTLVNDEVKNDKSKIPQLVDALSGVVDTTFLTSCIESGKYEKTMQRDSKIGDELGIQGTPGFFVNTQFYPGAYSYTDMDPVVQAALK